MATPPPQQPYPPQGPYQAPQQYQGPNPYQQPHPQPQYGYPQPAAAPGPSYGYPAPAPGPAPVDYPAGPYPTAAPPQFAGQQRVCRICGGFPAVEATIRGHQGILVMMRFLHLKGPFCRTCGTAVLRDMTGKTLVQGWWSPLSAPIFTPFTLIWNSVVRAKVKKLPPPAPGQPGPQLDPGAPLLRRPVALGLLVPVGYLIFVVVSIVMQVTRGS